MTMRTATSKLTHRGPCGSGADYAVCCDPLHQGQLANDAERLIRTL